MRFKDVKIKKGINKEMDKWLEDLAAFYGGYKDAGDVMVPTELTDNRCEFMTHALKSSMYNLVKNDNVFSLGACLCNKNKDSDMEALAEYMSPYMVDGKIYISDDCRGIIFVDTVDAPTPIDDGFFKTIDHKEVSEEEYNTIFYKGF